MSNAVASDLRKGKDNSTAILERKKAANQHFADEASNNGNPVVSLHPATLEKLQLFNGKTVLLKEKMEGLMMASINLETRGPVDLTQHPSGLVPTLQNIVSTVNLGCKLNLKAIALQARNAEYNPKRFAAVVMRMREPRTTALIFSSGKMVCTGAKGEEQSRLAARKYARVIQKLGFQSQFMDFKIQNIVASCDVKFPIRLEGLAQFHGAFCTYEPEIFPGLVYRMREPKIVLLIFVSGKIVLTGSKSRNETYRAFELIYPVLAEFKKVPTEVNHTVNDDLEGRKRMKVLQA